MSKGDPCSGRIRTLDRKSRCVRGDLWTGSDKFGDRNFYGVYGFRSACHHYGQRCDNRYGDGCFQEADIISMTMPITKHSYLVRDANELPRIVHEAFHIASTGRKGPVLLDIPKDISNQKVHYRQTHELRLRGYHAVPDQNPTEVDKLIQAIARSEKPVIIAGGGVVYSDASEELREFVHKTNIPVASTLLGLGGFPSAHDLWLGMAGHHGTYAANMAIQNADLILSVGSRFDDRVTMKTDGFAPHAKLIAHIDIDPAELGKNIQTDIAIVGDIKTCWNTRIREPCLLSRKIGFVPYKNTSPVIHYDIQIPRPSSSRNL